MLQTIPLDLIPPDHQVHATLYRDVQNAAFLQSQLLARNPAFEYAFIDASIVVSTTQVLAAAFRALAAKLSGTLKTPNVHSELVTSLSPSNNISEAYRRFGISQTTKDLLVMKITFPQSAEGATPPPTPEQIRQHLAENVQGTEVGFFDETIVSATDWSKVRKYYKLNGLSWLEGIKDEGEKRREMEGVILGGMALRAI